MGEMVIPDSRPKPFVLVLMPFDKAFDDVYRYGIRAVCEKLSLHCERVDEQHFEGTILDRIYNQIAKADIIVSDMTARNANVFYETGYAHALGKRVVLLTQNKDDIPFDLLHHPHIIYLGRVSDLEPALEKRLRWMIDNPSDSLSRVDLPLEIFFGSINLADRTPIPAELTHARRIHFALNIHNAGSRVIEPSDLQLACVSPDSFWCDDPLNSIPIADKTHIHILVMVPRIFPDGWAKITFWLEKTEPLKAGESCDFKLRVYSEIGARDYPMTVILQEV